MDYPATFSRLSDVVMATPGMTDRERGRFVSDVLLMHASYDAMAKELEALTHRADALLSRHRCNLTSRPVAATPLAKQAAAATPKKTPVATPLSRSQMMHSPSPRLQLFTRTPASPSKKRKTSPPKTTPAKTTPAKTTPAKTPRTRASPRASPRIRKPISPTGPRPRGMPRRR